MYKLVKDFNGSELKIIQKENTFIPMNPDNTDYQDYLAWLAEGNTPLPADSTP